MAPQTRAASAAAPPPPPPPGPLSAEGLAALRAHRYAAGTWGALDHVLNPFWDAVAARLPLWLAPNAITACATLLILTTLVANSAGTRADGTIAAPAHVYTALCIFLYQTLDAVDGKQARRTGTSSALGQVRETGAPAVGVPRAGGPTDVPARRDPWMSA